MSPKAEMANLFSPSFSFPSSPSLAAFLTEEEDRLEKKSRMEGCWEEGDDEDMTT